MSAGRIFLAALLAGALTGTNLSAAESDGALTAGKAAGVHKAQSQPDYYVWSLLGASLLALGLIAATASPTETSSTTTTTG